MLRLSRGGIPATPQLLPGGAAVKSPRKAPLFPGRCLFADSVCKSGDEPIIPACNHLQSTLEVRLPSYARPKAAPSDGASCTFAAATALPAGPSGCTSTSCFTKRCRSDTCAAAVKKEGEWVQGLGRQGWRQPGAGTGPSQRARARRAQASAARLHLPACVLVADGAAQQGPASRRCGRQLPSLVPSLVPW